MAFGVLSNPTTDPRRQAFGQGVLSLGASLLQGGQGGVLSNLGRGLGAFQRGQQGALNQQRQDQLYDLQLRGLQREDTAADEATRRRDEMAAAVADMEFPPEIESQIRAIARSDPEKALDLAYDYKIKTMEAGGAPKTVGGMLWNEQTKAFEPIPGYTDQASAIAAAGRAPAAPEALKTLEERDREIILSGDPSTQAYALAYANLFLTPKIVQGEHGAVPVMPHIPEGVRSPAYMGASGSPSGLPTAAPAIPGTFRPTEGQGLSSGYVRRMEAAEPLIEKFQAALVDPKQVVAGSIPLAGNYMVSPEYQQAYQAASDWVRAKLRKESGAVIADEEMAREIQIYFPQPGDSPAVIEQKRAARAEAMAAMRSQAGPAAPAAAPVKEWRVQNGKLVPVN